MKTKLCILSFLLLPLFAIAAEATIAVPPPPPADSHLSSLLMLLIPVLVPLIVALGKFIVPKVPTWMLPIIAPALGALLDFLTSLATGSTANPMIGALLGSAGVGVRELIDQVSGRMKEVAKPVTLFLLCAVLPIAVISPVATGCKGTPKETVIYNTFKSSWIVSKSAYDAWCEQVVLGKVTPEAEAKADAAWNKYRASFKVALALATTNWSAQTPASLDAAQKELLELLKLLSQ